MKKLLTLTLTSLLLTLAACNDADNNTGDSGEQSGDIVVETSVGNITEAELVQALKDNYGEEVLTEIIYNKLMTTQAEEKQISEEAIQEELDKLKESVGAPSDEQFYQMLQMQGIRGEEDLRQQILTHLVLQEHVGHVGDFSEEEIKAEYDRGEEVEARHILVSDEETALDLIEQINGGASFAELAEEHSSDSASAVNGGDLGSFRRGTMTPAFEETAFSLGVGEISQPVKSNYGYHIIEVTDKKAFEDDYEEVKDQLNKTLNDRKLSKMGLIQQELFRQIEVNVLDEQFSLDAFTKNNQN